MKRYILLRKNEEKGPCTLEEIIALQPEPMDLIWIEGSSNRWVYPGEIAELKAYVKEPAPAPLLINKNKSIPRRKCVSVILPPHYLQQHHDEKNAGTDHKAEEPQLEIKYEQPLEEIKEKYVAHQISRKKYTNKIVASLQHTGWMAALFTGLLLSAYMIKKMVDNAAFQEMRQTVAALPAAIPDSEASAKEADPYYRNALTREIIPVDTAAAKAPVKKTKKKVNIKKLVSVNASEYKTGLFGGIQDLKLSVNNKSDEVLDKVTIEVAYLKPSGETINTKDFEIRAVDPKSSKTIAVPSSKRGVKIKYRIKGIKSHPFKPDLIEI